MSAMMSTNPKCVTCPTAPYFLLAFYARQPTQRLTNLVQLPMIELLGKQSRRVTAAPRCLNYRGGSGVWVLPGVVSTSLWKAYIDLDTYR